MAWNKELTKEDLIKAGLDPADLAEMKANGVKKADLDAFKTEMTTSIMDSIKTQFTELETKLRSQPKTEDDNKDQKDTQDDATEFLTDPTAYINKKVGQVVGYSAIQTTKMRMDLALDRAKSSLRGFKNQALTDEIMTEWSSYKPENMAMVKDFDPDKLLLKVHNMVMGNHIDDINRDTDKKDGKFNMVASGGGGGGVNQNFDITKKPEDQITDIEKKQATRYGMTAEEWVKQQKEMAEEENKSLTGGV